jgi:hypothetical protein
MPSKWFKRLWLIWAIAGGILETWAIKDIEKGDTLTEQVRAIVKKPALRWMGIGLSVWAFLHFFYNKD